MKSRADIFLTRGSFTAIALLVLVIVTYLKPTIDEGHVRRGLLFTTREVYVTGGTWALLTLCLAAFLPTLLNKAYDYMRDVGLLTTSLFLVATLPLYRHLFLGTGIVMPLIVSMLAVNVFESFDDKNSQQRALIAGAVIGTGVLFDYAYLLVAVPVVLGLINAKAVGWRVSAALLSGFTAPAWIALGTAMAHLHDVQPCYIKPVWLTDVTDTADVLQLSTTGVIALFAVVLMVSNLVKTFTMRLVLRVYNSYFHFATFGTVVALIIDYGNCATFLPVLALCLAHQCTLHFSISSSVGKYAPTVTLIIFTVIQLALDLLPVKLV